MEEGLYACVFVVDWQVLASADLQAKAVCVLVCVQGWPAYQSTEMGSQL